VAKQIKSPDDLKKASKALYYEIKMLNESANKHKLLTTKNDVIWNALIESFCVHLRNFIEFFGKQRKDHITYELFTSGKSIEFKNNLKKDYPNKVNNLLSHLTFKRLEFYGSGKDWDIQSIANEVNENIKLFLENAEADLICDELNEYINTVEKKDDKNICATGVTIGSASFVQSSKNSKRL